MVIDDALLDDALLSDLLSEAGRDVDVPVDGPERILASRDAARAASRRNSRPPRRRRMVAVVGAAGALAAFGFMAASVTVGSSSGPRSLPALGNGGASMGSNQPETSSAGQASFGPEAGSESGSVAAGGSGVSAKAAQLQTSPNQVPTLPSRVIKTGTISLEVARGNLSGTISVISDLAGGFGGFVASSSTNITNTGEAPYGDITLRVPVGKFDQLVAQVVKAGTATSVSTSGQDVTSQYVDLQARIQSLDDARTQFQQILARAQTIGDLLSVEQQISDLQTQIEQLQGQLQVMDDQTRYSTLTVHVTEAPKKTGAVKPARPPSGISKAWAHARHSFAHGVEAVIGATGGIAVFLLFAGLVAVAARFGWTAVRRRLI